MSFVTDVYIIAAPDEERAIAWLNDWLCDNAPSHKTLNDLSGAVGGQKWPQVTIVGAALNYAPAGLRAKIAEAPWRSPESVVIVWQDENDEGPRAFGVQSIHEEVAG